MKHIKFYSVLALVIIIFASFSNGNVNNYLLNKPQPPAENNFFDIVMLTSNSDILWRNKITPNVSFTTAMFCSNPGVDVTINSFKQVDSVFNNSKALKYKTFFYVDTNFVQHQAPIVWDVYGNNGFPSFSYTNPDSIPSYTGYNLLPDTIYANADATFNISDFAYAEKVGVWLSDSGHIIKKPLVNSNTVTFTQSEIASNFTVTKEISITVKLTKQNVQTISGKRINFINQYSLVKIVTLINNSNNVRVKK